MLRNSEHEWGSISKSFHWLIVLLIAVEVPVGYLMSYTYGLSFRDKQQALPLHTLASQIHHTIGLAILLLAVMRLIWRWTTLRPRQRPGHAYGALTAGIVHGALYTLLIVLPLSGWAAISVYGDAPLWLFDHSDLVPAILPRVPLKDAHGYGYYAKIHVLCLKIGLGVLTLHVAAALWHHWVRRDDVLLRMWPLAKSKTSWVVP